MSGYHQQQDGNRVLTMTTKDKEKRTILQIKKVKKVFARGTIDEVTALNGVNLNVYDQDFVTIIGSNGAGKSTLLNIVAGVFPPERGGKVIINGDDVTNLAEYRCAAYVGRVWQEPEVGTARKLTIEENLSLALLRGQKRGVKGAINKQRREIFREALSLLGLGLEDRLKTPVGTLSGGQRQALALVMATISRPTILLLDEHIATLDPKTAKTVLGLTDKIVRREKMSAIMVTHNMEIALHHGNRLIMMHKGKIIADIGQADKKALTINDLVTAFERAAGEEFKDDAVLLSRAELV
ncbi:MAG TPA: ATP-binding cassette domain-containing protein [Dehalococcoidales bacterium]|nr:ATP-binding cassette domain-containing protein [Dehalococcoidales bacterium]